MCRTYKYQMLTCILYRLFRKHCVFENQNFVRVSNQDSNLGMMRTSYQWTLQEILFVKLIKNQLNCSQRKIFQEWLAMKNIKR